MDEISKAREALHDGFQGTVVVQVVRFDVRDDRAFRVNVQEGAVVLAGLTRKPTVRVTDGSVRAHHTTGATYECRWLRQTTRG